MMSSSDKAVRVLGTFTYSQEERQRFRTAFLWQKWARLYPALFDADDCRIAKTQARLGYHFFEWLAAIRIYETTGYLSLVEKYEFKAHQRKHLIAKKLLPSNVQEILSHRNRQCRVQCPDLLAYAANFSDWYFCEVKADKDFLRKEQLEFFEKLAAATGKQVSLINYSKGDVLS